MPMTQTMPRLSDATLHRLPSTVARPRYDRHGLTTGIVHLGIGAFNRAHQAVYVDAILAGGDNAWGILGVSLRSSETRDALAPQDNLYTLAVRDQSGERLQVVGSITAILVAPEDPEALLAAMVRPDVRIVSLTVTEKGYCYLPATGSLDEAHPDIVHDLANPGSPRSAVGFVVEALRRRRNAGTSPFTVLSCDNLPANGRTVRRVAMRFAELRDPALAAFVAQDVAFPSTMVDRIVPQSTDDTRLAVSASIGLEDTWPIATEPFCQWVVEDRFPLGRPAWETVGVTFVADVEPFELMKLRLLNGSHSLLAYLGYLAGHETVADAMAAPGFAALLTGFMDDEVTPTLPPLAGFDLSAYKSSLLARFRNPALRHRTWQIAMDGTQKLPQRFLHTIRARLAAGAPIERLGLGVAAFMRYAAGIDEKGDAIDVRDPLADRIRSLTAGRTAPAEVFDAYMTMDDVFGADLPADPRFRSAVEGALGALLAAGSAATVLRYGASAQATPI